MQECSGLVKYRCQLTAAAAAGAKKDMKLYAVEYGPDGKSFWTSDSDGKVHHWELDETHTAGQCKQDKAVIKADTICKWAGSFTAVEEREKPKTLRVDVLKLVPEKARKFRGGRGLGVGQEILCAVDTAGVSQSHTFTPRLSLRCSF
jgi:hypothetical protein